MSPVTRAPFPGTKRFQLLRRLGQGGMGTVFAAVDKDHGTTVALKTLNQMTADGLLLFKNEFRALADIQHENLASLYELIEDQGQWFFTMELLPGVDFISHVRPLPDGAADPEYEGATSDIPLSHSQTPPPPEPAPAPAMDEDASPSASPAAAQAPHPGQLDESRLRAALVQLGRGLHALHTADKIHRDIKPHNRAAQRYRLRTRIPRPQINHGSMLDQY